MLMGLRDLYGSGPLIFTCDIFCDNTLLVLCEPDLTSSTEEASSSKEKTVTDSDRQPKSGTEFWLRAEFEFD
jgi:hypothetical protein